jgi:hypothetical protein
MVVLGVVTLLDGIIFGADVGWRWCCSGGNPGSESPGSDDGDARREHHFWSSHWLVVVLRWSGVSPPALMMVGFGGVVTWKLDGGCMLCCVCREEEPSSTMVASMASLVRGFTSV